MVFDGELNIGILTGTLVRFNIAIFLKITVKFTEIYKTFSMFPYSYRNTGRSLGEREIDVGAGANEASVSTQFRVLPIFHECFDNVREQGENVFNFFYKITSGKQNVEISFFMKKIINSPYS